MHICISFRRRYFVRFRALHPNTEVAQTSKVALCDKSISLRRFSHLRSHVLIIYVNSACTMREAYRAMCRGCFNSSFLQCLHQSSHHYPIPLRKRLVPKYSHQLCRIVVSEVVDNAQIIGSTEKRHSSSLVSVTAVPSIEPSYFSGVHL